MRKIAPMFAILSIAACNSTDSELASARLAMASLPTIEDFQLASDCAGCPVGAITKLNLPETKVDAYSAKLLMPGGRVVTLLGDMTPTSEVLLVKAENAARRARYGNMTSMLRAVVATTSEDTIVPVAIWTAAHIDYPRKEDLIADPTALTAHQASVKSALGRVTSPVVAWLTAQHCKVVEDGSDSPLVRAEVPVGLIDQLSSLPGIDFVAEEPVIHPQGYDAWYSTVRADQAALLSTGAVTICNASAGQPSDYTNLVVNRPGDVAVPTGFTSTHDLATMAIIRNNGTSGLTMTTASTDLVDNWDNLSVNVNWVGWCWNRGAIAANFSYGGVTTPGGPQIIDYKFDYYTKTYPYTLMVAASGDSNAVGSDTVAANGARGYNYLIVGGSDDKGTATLSDDTNWDGSGGYGSSWRNPTSLHNDRELPHVVAPASGALLNISGLYGSFGGTSAAAPMVTGAVALLVARDSSFVDWPEMTRAVVIASSVHMVNGSQVTTLPDPNGDLKQGGGLLNAKYAATLAAPSVFTSPGSAAVSMGRYCTTVRFATDFDTYNMSNDVFNIKADFSGRMRVVLTFDASATSCDSSGNSCTGDGLDGDLDLVVGDSSGHTVCHSSTYDSSWELCDFAVTAGQVYTARYQKYATTNGSISTVGMITPHSS